MIVSLTTDMKDEPEVTSTLGVGGGGGTRCIKTVKILTKRLEKTKTNSDSKMDSVAVTHQKQILKDRPHP